MSMETVDQTQLVQGARPEAPTATGLHPTFGYAAGLAGVLIAAGVAFVVQNIVPSADLTLVFVLPVLLVALNFGWAPALFSTVAAVAAFDFFFAPPIFSLRVSSPSDLWAMGLLLAVAAIASTVAAQTRRSALEAQLSTDRAEALHRLAHLVVEAAPAKRVSEAAADALAKIFAAPAVVFVERGGRMELVAKAGGATLSSVDEDAARWALTNRLATHGETFPFDEARFDFWPFSRDDGQGVVLGVGPSDERPKRPVTYTETVGAYLVAGLSPDTRPTGRRKI